MPRSVHLTLTESAIAGFFFIQRYRFLTIDQFARATGLHRTTAADQLRVFSRHALLGYFGNTGLNGHGKTPKAYFLTRKGWELLHRESDIPPELLGTHKEIKVEARVGQPDRTFTGVLSPSLPRRGLSAPFLTKRG